LGILITGGLLILLIFSTEPAAKRSGATQQTAMLVNVINAERGSFQPTIEAMGTVEPAREITLSPRVSGEIIGMSINFTPGGYVQKGDTLLQLNSEDYEHQLQQRKSELSQAESDLTLELGRQEAARKEYTSYGDSLSPANQARVLRQPQLKSIRARVQADEAAVEQAKLDLKRTTITAPFDAHILERNVNIGSQVAVGNNLGQLVGLDEYWVEATVPVSKLNQLRLPEENKQGASVRIRNRTAWSDSAYRTGYVDKLIGSLENQTRMARLLITVPDPHSYTTDTDEPKLMIGSFVETNIQGQQLQDVVRLNRDYIRGNNTVWVMENKQLRIRDVNVMFQDAHYAYINRGLNDGDRVVTTNLSTVSDGAPLRLAEEASPDTSSSGDNY
jgi:RND family efflux transporter MFP subunit